MFLVDYMTLEIGLVLIPIILSFIAQAAVSSAYSKGNHVEINSGKTGAELAREMLMSNGISDVQRFPLRRGFRIALGRRIPRPTAEISFPG